MATHHRVILVTETTMTITTITTVETVVLAEVDRDLLHVGAAEAGVAVVVDPDRPGLGDDDRLLDDTVDDRGAVVSVQAALAVDHLPTEEDTVAIEIDSVVQEEPLAMVEEKVVEEKTTEETMDRPVDHMVNPIMIPMAQVNMAPHEEEDLLHPVVEEIVEEIDDAVAVRKVHPESRSWSEMYLLTLPLGICSGPLARLERFGMSTFQETTTRRHQRGLLLLNMLTLRRPGRHAMRWIDFESRGGSWKLSLPKSVAKLQTK